MGRLATDVTELAGHEAHENGNGKSDFEKLCDKPFVPQRPPTDVLAEQLGVPRDILVDTIRRSIMPRDSSNADFLAFCQIAAKYKLNPFTREIFAIPRKGGGVQIVVPIDGWVSIVQRSKAFDGWTFEDLAGDDASEFLGTRCTIYRKDRSHPTVITEWYNECRRESEPWKQYPRRMTRHKALIQGARVAFGIGGIYDEEEGSIAAGYTNVEEAIQNTPRKKLSLIKPEPEPNPTGESESPSPSPSPPQAPAPNVATETAARAPIKTTRPGPRKTAPAPVDPPPPEDTQTHPPYTDDPRTPQEKAEEYSTTVPPGELRRWLMSIPPKARQGAMTIAQVNTIMEDSCSDDDLRTVAYNAKLAELQ